MGVCVRHHIVMCVDSRGCTGRCQGRAGRAQGALRSKNHHATKERPNTVRAHHSLCRTSCSAGICGVATHSFVCVCVCVCARVCVCVCVCVCATMADGTACAWCLSAWWRVAHSWNRSTAAGRPASTPRSKIPSCVRMVAWRTANPLLLWQRDTSPWPARDLTCCCCVHTMFATQCTHCL